MTWQAVMPLEETTVTLRGVCLRACGVEQLKSQSTIHTATALTF